MKRKKDDTKIKDGKYREDISKWKLVKTFPSVPPKNFDISLSQRMIWDVKLNNLYLNLILLTSKKDYTMFQIIQKRILIIFINLILCFQLKSHFIVFFDKYTLI